MVQYHPTTLAGSGFLMTEAARGEGAYLLNSLGERFHEELRAEQNGARRARRDFARRGDRDCARGAASTATFCSTCAISDPTSSCKQAAADPRDGARLSRDRHDQRSRSGSSRACTTRWAASRPMSTARRAVPVSMPRARSPASACTAEIASAPTRCSIRSSSAGARVKRRPQYAQRTCGARRRRGPAARRARAARAICWRGRTPARRLRGLRLELATMMDKQVGLYRDDAGLRRGAR